ncbi:MAG: hypothetical protein LAP85_29780, partial [Acidobacteriia bacterium]|nr:hypothetical protein [Terriglobia bacterium]
MPPGTRAYAILVEAVGYIPDISQSVDDEPAKRNLEITLVPTAGFTGIVLLPNGSSVSGANVFLCGSNGQSAASSLGSRMMTSIKSIRSVNQPSNSDLFTAAVVTDDLGRFSLKPVPQADSIFATHEKGFAALTIEESYERGCQENTSPSQGLGRFFRDSQPSLGSCTQLTLRHHLLTSPDVY